MKALRGRGDLALGLALLGVLVALTLVFAPARLAPGNLGTQLGLATPLILAAVAVMVPFLAGGGSIDVSVGPVIGMINVLTVAVLIGAWGLTSPWVIVPAVLTMGLVSGLLNGLLAVTLRIQPIVATLGTYLVWSGLARVVLSAPAGSVPPWLRALSGPWSILPLAAAVLLWLALKRLPWHEALLATGGDDRAAWTSGIDVPRLRLLAYIVGGLFAAMAALSLTGLIGSGDPNIGPPYTLLAIAAAALGGVSLAGGSGGLLAALVGALDIWLLQSLLTTFNVSTFVLQLAYGAILVLAVSLNAPALRAMLPGDRL